MEYGEHFRLQAVPFSGGCRFLGRAIQDRLSAVLDAFSGYDLVRYVLGIWLLVAAILKCVALSTQPVFETSVWDSRWFGFTRVEVELAFGLFLIFGLAPRVARVLAMIGFALFALVAAAKALSGATTCDCFGAVSAPPGPVALLDLSAVMALWCFAPKSPKPPPPCRKRLHGVGVSRSS
jgi:hypothetical protein